MKLRLHQIFLVVLVLGLLLGITAYEFLFDGHSGGAIRYITPTDAEPPPLGTGGGGGSGGGHGGGKSDLIPPVITFSKPFSGTMALSRQIAIDITYSDIGTGVDWETFTLTVNGLDDTNQVRAGNYRATGTITVPSDGETIITADVNDLLGNQGTASAALYVLTNNTSAKPIVGSVDWNRISILSAPYNEAYFNDQLLIDFVDSTSTTTIQTILNNHDLIAVGAIPEMGLYQVTWDKQSGVNCLDSTYYEIGNACNSGEVWSNVLAPNYPQIERILEQSIDPVVLPVGEKIPAGLQSGYSQSRSPYFTNEVYYTQHFLLKTFPSMRLAEAVVGNVGQPVRLTIGDTGFGTGYQTNGEVSADVQFNQLTEPTYFKELSEKLT